LKRPLEVSWPNPCSGRDTQSKVLRTRSRQLMEVSKEGTLQPLDSLRQCSIILTAQKYTLCGSPGRTVTKELQPENAALRGHPHTLIPVKHWRIED